MKKTFYTLVATGSSLLVTTNATNAGVFDSLFESEEAKNPYCNPDTAGENGCGLKEGIETVGEANINGVITGDTESSTLFEYLQNFVGYLLGFITIIAVLYIIYAGFMVLTAAGDEEKVKDMKKTITYVAIGMAVMWLAYAIVMFVVSALNAANDVTSIIYM